MDDLRQKISKAAKKMWSEMPPEIKKERLSRMGKSGSKKRWEGMTPEQRKEHINKMNQGKYGLRKLPKQKNG